MSTGNDMKVPDYTAWSRSDLVRALEEAREIILLNLQEKKRHLTWVAQSSGWKKLRRGIEQCRRWLDAAKEEV